MNNFKLLLFLFIFLISCSKEIDKKQQYVLAYISEPRNHLIPADTAETEGNKIVSLLFSGLVTYDDQGNIVNEVAKKISTKDKKRYIIHIKHGMKFSDGSDLTVKNFVDAWNYVIKEKLLLRSFFSDIEGYPEEGEDFKKLTGLKIINDYTFSINLKYPVYDFIYKLGFTAFYPMHDIAFKDIKEYGQYPIGNGPYKLSSKDSWQHNKNITLVKNNYYKGYRNPKNKGIIFNVYTLLSAAYADLLSGQLDILEAIPSEQLNSYHTDLNNRFIDKNTLSNSALSINFNNKHFHMDKEGSLRRKAISMAIDRNEISKVIFYNTRKPSEDFTAFKFLKYNKNLKGKEVLQFNPDEAKKLWEEADNISKFDDVFTISYNADGGHFEWIEAICNQLKNNLGIEVVANPYPDFKSFLDDIMKLKIKYGFRTGWAADYPAVSTFLEKYLSYSPISGNSVSYKNDKFDELYKNAMQSINFTQYQYYIRLCQEVLLEDLPDIPLFYSMTNGGFSKNVKNVKFGWDYIPLYYNIIKE